MYELSDRRSPNFLLNKRWNNEAGYKRHQSSHHNPNLTNSNMDQPTEPEEHENFIFYCQSTLKWRSRCASVIIRIISYIVKTWQEMLKLRMIEPRELKQRAWGISDRLCEGYHNSALLPSKKCSCEPVDILHCLFP